MGTDNKRKPPVLVNLCCLAKPWLACSIPPPTLSLKVLSALFCTVYWSPKTVPWLPAKYICYYGNQSKQGNWKKNRGQLKTWLIWIYGFEIKSVEVCWCFSGLSPPAQNCNAQDLNLCHVLSISCFLQVRINNPKMKPSYKGNMLWNVFSVGLRLNITLIHRSTDRLTDSRISLTL